MARRQSWTEDIATDIAEWIEHESDQLAEALTGSGPAPFSQNLTAEERLQFFTHAVFNPDGTPNLQGRERIMLQYGPKGYATIMRAVLVSYQPRSLGVAV